MPFPQIKRVTNDSKSFRDRGEGDLTKTIRIRIDEKSGASSVVCYNGHENMLNARINEIPSLVHSTNNCVVISQLYDAAYFKDGIFRYSICTSLIVVMLKSSASYTTENHPWYEPLRN
jgi:hypothetical protein